VVVLDRMSAGVPSVLANHSQAEHLAAEHLSGLGHQHISYVAGPVKSWADGSRWHCAAERGRRLAPAGLPARAVHADRGWRM